MSKTIGCNPEKLQLYSEPGGLHFKLYILGGGLEYVKNTRMSRCWGIWPLSYFHTDGGNWGELVCRKDEAKDKSRWQPPAKKQLVAVFRQRT